jgi:hypothetical protein
MLPIFGDGNTNYGALAKDHKCTEFCEFYGVPKGILGREEPPRNSAPPLPPISPTSTNEFPPGLMQLKQTGPDPTTK